MNTLNHWHVATGFAGYGPDGADGFGTADNVQGAADLIRADLADEIDASADTAAGHAEALDYESAWKVRAHADMLETMRMNVSNERAQAPLYRDSAGAWDAALVKIIGEKFPLDLDYQGRRRLYAWECTNVDCDQVTDNDN